MMVVTRLIKGYPLSVTPDTRLVVRELDRATKRYRCERDDGRDGTWWVDGDSIRLIGG